MEEEPKQKPDDKIVSENESGASHGDERSTRDGDQAPKKRGGRLRFLKKGLPKKILIMALGVIFLFAGLGLVKEQPEVREWINKHYKKSTISGPQERLQEEAISPLFIPLKGGGSRRVIMVSFSAIWDTVASVHFKKMELEIRNQIYQRLKMLAEKKRGGAGDIPEVEFEIRKTLRKMMGRADLDIRVKEVKAY